LSEIPLIQAEEIGIGLAFVNCLERAFSKFGQSVFTVVYWKFHFNTNLTKEDIVKRPDLFSGTIKEIFQEGSQVIERSIISELKYEFNLPDRNYKDLEDVVNSIRIRGSTR